MTVTETTAVRPGSRRHSVFHRLRVASVERLTDDAVAVTFDVPQHLGADYAFTAGQHVNVSVPGGDGIRRSYSICAPQGQDCCALRSNEFRTAPSPRSRWARCHRAMSSTS